MSFSSIVVTTNALRLRFGNDGTRDFEPQRPIACPVPASEARGAPAPIAGGGVGRGNGPYDE